MSIKIYKPVTASQRGTILLDSSELTGKKPEKTLCYGKKRISCRDSKGRITIRRRGGGAKRKYRIIDFRRDKFNISGTIKAIEYDPNRNANIALVLYADGEKRYILAPDGITIGQEITSGENAPVATGNTLPLEKIPLGTFIHNIELKPGRGGQIARAAGVAAKIISRDGKYISIQLPSSEIRLILAKCQATIGTIGNKEHENQQIGKAGRKRWMGRRPKVRGVAMNPVDHPLGGGEGRTSGGQHPVSPTGVPAKGYKTRSKKKYSNQFIISRRKK